MVQYTRSLAEQFRAEETTVGWSWRMFIFSIVVFASVVLLYFGMSFGYAPYLNSRIAALDDEIKKLNEQIPLEDQKKLVAYFSQIYNIQNLLADHLLPSKLFAFLETNAVKQIQYTKVNFAQDTASLIIEGSTNSYDALVKQTEAFRRNPMVENAALSNSNADSATGRVQFSLRINLARQFLSR